MSGTTRSSENAQECFDYIVNTRLTYDLLGEALAQLIRRAKNQRHSVAEELANPCADRKTQFPGDRGPRKMRVPIVPGWLRTARSAITIATKDYLRFFREEDPQPAWIKGVDAKLVLKHAFIHRDWWSGTKEKPPSNLEEEKGIKAIIALQAFAGIVESVEKARSGWRSMPPRAREITMATYARLVERKP